MGVLETGFSGRAAPFFSLPKSKVFEHEPTFTEAMTLAGIDFTVDKRPVYQQTYEGSFVEVPGTFATFRTDTEAVLGIVKKKYTVFQNEEAMSLVDELLGFGAEIAAAGSWNGGADVFITARLQNGVRVAGEVNLNLFLLLRANHSGSGSVSAYITPIRIQCTNMERLAVKNAVSSWSVRHTASINDRVQEAAAALRLVDEYTVELEATIRQLQDTEVTIDGFEKLVEDLKMPERIQQNALEVWDTSPTVGSGRTRSGWDAINVITETTQWFPGRNTAIERRFGSLLDGPVQRTTERATRLLLRR